MAPNVVGARLASIPARRARLPARPGDRRGGARVHDEPTGRVRPAEHRPGVDVLQALGQGTAAHRSDVPAYASKGREGRSVGPVDARAARPDPTRHVSR
ncbi:MAG: hypothetical protein CMP58_03480 [Flavobacteriales bacterium]|nr:hypothetical protein [Flavobacteriales bacterium]